MLRLAGPPHLQKTGTRHLHRERKGQGILRHERQADTEPSCHRACSETDITIYARDLSAGMYTYTLVVDVVYVQNDTITGTEVISADSIYVGKDVTNTKEYGEVILGQGDITLKAKSVTIKNSTTVPLGTKFRINNP